MICTVTFNPSLDYIVSVDDFQLGMTGFHSPGICGGIHWRGTDPEIERVWRKC